MGRHFFVEPPNCYVTFTYGGREYNTETHENATSPQWPDSKHELAYDGQPISIDFAIMQRSAKENVKIASVTVKWDRFLPGLRKVADYLVTPLVPGVKNTAAIRVAATLQPQSMPKRPAGPRRKALFVGICYEGTDWYLPKCHEDAEKMKNLFCGHWGFIDSPENTKCLIDWRDAPDSTRPTLANIKAGMRWLVEGAMPGDSLLFFYCGHGSQQRNVDRREKDGFDEVLVPVDGKTEGMLVDDEINEMLVQPLPAGVRLTCFLDSCHSGGGLDLPYQWNPYMEEGASWHLDEGGVYADADVICVSAAAEDQTAKGIPRLGNRENFPSGAFSASWCVACEVHETQCKMNWKEMLGIVKEVCDDFNWSQNVQLSSSQKFDLTREFNFHDCIPNSNDKKGPVVNDGMPGFPRRNRLMDPTFSGFKVP
ncbi:unnamed protein product [Cladocopium goreaui]|uniref:Metacaspase-1 n=1 Tax=Cladocopium goreaui TaxID=2562237 RepID=A0A9P1FRV8_9DINO|nr:unnamed protein product [Cladocopium goreaui]